MVESVIQVKSRTTTKVGASVTIQRKHCTCKKNYIWNPATCSCKTGKYLASITDDSVITCDEIIDVEAKSYDRETEIVTTDFNEKNAICKTKKNLCFISLFDN